MKIFNISPKSVAFEFLGNTLNQNNTFSHYGIKNSQLHVEIFLFNKNKLGDYYFKPATKQDKDKDETIKDIIDLLKLEYDINDNNDSDFTVEIFSEPNQDSKLDEKELLKNHKKLYASFKKTKIRLLEPKGKRIEFDSILKPTKEFIKTEILPLIQEESLNDFALYRRANLGHYVIIDELQLFLFKKVSNIEFIFNGNQIKLSNKLMISEFESVNSIIKYYLSELILANPDSIKLYVKGTEYNNKKTIKDILSTKKKIEIRLKDVDSTYKEKDSKNSPNKKVHIKPPKITLTAVHDDEKNSPNSKNKKLDDLKSSKNKVKKEEEKEKEKKREKKKDEEEKKNEKEEEEKEKKKEEKEEEKGDEEEKKDEEKKKEDEEENIDEEEEEGKDNIKEKHESSVKSGIEVVVEEEEEGDENSKSKGDDNNGDVDDDGDDEEEEEENKDEEGEERYYTFVIKGKEPFEISLNKDATLKNAMEKIAERENVTIDDVSIIFAGKKLRRTTVIAKMKLKKGEAVDVMISEPMETLLKTAKALKILPSDFNDDDEYEYSYEEEDEYDDEEEE